MNNNLNQLGWQTYLKKSEINNIIEYDNIARVCNFHGSSYEIYDGRNYMEGILEGKFHYGDEEHPVVGDWVLIQRIENENKAIIKEILPRINYLSRKKPGKKTNEQTMVSNIDTAFIVQSLDDDFSVNRFERYIIMCRQNNIYPVLILNKSDLCNDIDKKFKVIRDSFPEIEIHLLKAGVDKNISSILKYINNDETCCFLGSSGVGKSTIINLLLKNDILKVSEVREKDSKGRHTTTFRKLFLLPDEGIVIDTPGMRELELWDCSPGISETFDDIKKIADGCAFKDCTHEHEPGCQVMEAVNSGKISLKHLENYKKILKEYEFQLSKRDEQSRFFQKQKEKKFKKECKRIIKGKEKLKNYK